MTRLTGFDARTNDDWRNDAADRLEALHETDQLAAFQDLERQAVERLAREGGLIGAEVRYLDGTPQGTVTKVVGTGAGIQVTYEGRGGHTEMLVEMLDDKQVFFAGPDSDEAEYWTWLPTLLRQPATMH